MSIGFEYPHDAGPVLRQGRTTALGALTMDTMIDVSLIGADIPLGTLLILYTDDINFLFYRPVTAFNVFTGEVTFAPANWFPIPIGIAYAFIVSGAGASVGSFPGSIAVGTFTTSSASAPRDNLRTEGNNYWDGCLLMPLTGVCAFQVRRIVTWTNVLGIFTLDFTVQPFTAAPGLVTYVILPAQTEYVPVQNSIDDVLPRDVIGNKTDTAVRLANNAASIIAYLKAMLPGSAYMATGTFTTSSATVPADNVQRTEASNFWDGCLLVPLTGACAFQARRIETFANAGGVMTIVPGKAFTAVTGLVAYVILADQLEYRAVTNSSDDVTMADVIGGKNDTSVLSVSAIRSLMMYVKGIVTNINGLEVKGESAAANLFAGAVNIISLAADGNRKELNGVFLSMVGSGASVTVGATVTIRVYRAVNGVEYQVDLYTVIRGTDPDAIPVVNSWVPIENNSLGAVTTFRVSMQSNNAADVAVLIPYSYTTKIMQF